MWGIKMPNGHQERIDLLNAEWLANEEAEAQALQDYYAIPKRSQIFLDHCVNNTDREAWLEKDREFDGPTSEPTS